LHKYDKVLKIDGVAFTKAGKELLNIIPIKNVSEYKLALIQFFESRKLKMVEVSF